MNERFDHVTLDGGRPAAVRICGVFEIKDGQIKAWRDYFDQSGAGAA
jgi:limonene-1,2-epoxide hydrolase